MKIKKCTYVCFFKLSLNNRAISIILKDCIALFTVQCEVRNMKLAVYGVKYSLFIKCTVHSVQCDVYIVHCVEDLWSVHGESVGASDKSSVVPPKCPVYILIVSAPLHIMWTVI